MSFHSRLGRVTSKRNTVPDVLPMLPNTIGHYEQQYPSCRGYVGTALYFSAGVVPLRENSLDSFEKLFLRIRRKSFLPSSLYQL